MIDFLLTLLLTLFGGALLLILGYGLGCEHCKVVFRAASKFIATLFGRSGDFTLSAELGVGASLPWRLGRAFVNSILGSGHCENAAVREGLI